MEMDREGRTALPWRTSRPSCLRVAEAGAGAGKSAIQCAVQANEEHIGRKVAKGGKAGSRAATDVIDAASSGDQKHCRCQAKTNWGGGRAVRAPHIGSRCLLIL